MRYRATLEHPSGRRLPVVRESDTTDGIAQIVKSALAQLAHPARWEVEIYTMPDGSPARLSLRAISGVFR